MKNFIQKIFLMCALYLSSVCFAVDANKALYLAVYSEQIVHGAHPENAAAYARKYVELIAMGVHQDDAEKCAEGELLYLQPTDYKEILKGAYKFIRSIPGYILMEAMLVFINNNLESTKDLDGEYYQLLEKEKWYPGKPSADEIKIESDLFEALYAIRPLFSRHPDRAAQISLSGKDHLVFQNFVEALFKFFEAMVVLKLEAEKAHNNQLFTDEVKSLEAFNFVKKLLSEVGRCVKKVKKNVLRYGNSQGVATICDNFVQDKKQDFSQRLALAFNQQEVVEVYPQASLEDDGVSSLTSSISTLTSSDCEGETDSPSDTPSPEVVHHKQLSISVVSPSIIGNSCSNGSPRSAMRLPTSPKKGNIKFQAKEGYITRKEAEDLAKIKQMRKEFQERKQRVKEQIEAFKQQEEVDKNAVAVDPTSFTSSSVLTKEAQERLAELNENFAKEEEAFQATLLGTVFWACKKIGNDGIFGLASHGVTEYVIPGVSLVGSKVFDACSEMSSYDMHLLNEAMKHEDGGALALVKLAASLNKLQM